MIGRLFEIGKDRSVRIGLEPDQLSVYLSLLRVASITYLYHSSRRLARHTQISGISLQRSGRENWH
jgi:hypothetical protein